MAHLSYKPPRYDREKSKPLAIFLEDLRRPVFYTPEEAAEAISRSRSTVTKWENETHLAPRGYLAFLAQRHSEQFFYADLEGILLGEVNKAIKHSLVGKAEEFRDWNELCEEADAYLARGAHRTEEWKRREGAIPLQADEGSFPGVPPAPSQIQDVELQAGQHSASNLLARYSRVHQFRSLIEERTKAFVGREYVFKEIEGYLGDLTFTSGYIVIQGEPGIGKTALLAHLVKRNGYVHHFNIASQNIRSPRDFLASICAQLITRYQLGHLSLPPEALTDSGFLLQLLREASEKRPEELVVIAIDALDEVEDGSVSAGNNPLYLPEALPEGVFVIVTSRAKEAGRLRVDRRRDIHLRDDDPLNRADVRRYSEDFVQRHRDRMSSAITAWKVDNDEFIGIIADKSQGNFMYLVYVLDDIRDGRLTAATVDNIQNLPSGLRAYYEQHWDRMRAVNADRFDRYYEPVLCILASVFEPVSILQLAEWTKLSPIRVTEVVSEWRSFLNGQETEQREPLYHLYHRSFQDFLADKVGLMRYHGLIVDAALAKTPWKREIP